MQHTVYSAQQLREIMRDHNLKAVARSSGISYHTLWAFVVRGIDSRASFNEKLTKYIDTKHEEAA